MADKKENPESEPNSHEPVKKSKKGLFLSGGMVLLVTVGYFGATMGVTSKKAIPRYEGPFVVPLSTETLNIDLAAPDSGTFLVMMLNAIFDAYSADELEGRLEDSLFLALLQDQLWTLASTKTEAMIQSKDSQDAFMAEIQAAIDPICFPVHIGDSDGPFGADSKSGIKPGDSTQNASLRGRYFDHRLYVDSVQKTIRLDEGEEVAFVGDEVDLPVTNAEGHFVFLNMTGLEPEFVGELQIGVKGRIRRVLHEKFNTQ